MTDTGIAPGDPVLERRLRAALEGEVRFDAFTRGLYATDASHYQIEPLGVVFPRSVTDVEATMEIARETGAPVLPRGGGTSQCGQTVGRAVVLDTSRHLTGVGRGDIDARGAVVDGAAAIDRGAGAGLGGGGRGRRDADGTGVGGPDGTGVGGPDGILEGPHGPEIEVQPGVVLDHLNALLRSEGLWFPVDPSTGSRATLGGMAGNNSAGARSIRYGMMVDNVSALELVLPDGRRSWLGETAPSGEAAPSGTRSTASDVLAPEIAELRAIFTREADEIARRTPRTMRNVAGYNLDRLHPERGNPAQLLVGSEGTLAFFSRLRLRLSPLPTRRVLGICRFPDLVSALDSVQHLVRLDPSAVELVDGKVLRLAAENETYRSAMARFVRGTHGALLLVEFASGAGPRSSVGSRDQSAAPSGGPDPVGSTGLDRKLELLAEMLADLGHPDAVTPAITPKEQATVWSVRKAGLSIVMSMAGPRKPVSFIEDCAVPLEHLAEYAMEVEEIFQRHDTSGTWYAHASVGCLHVRPALNLKDPEDVARIRRIAEETHEVVRRLGGTHSGEHGDGILRSEFLEAMLGQRLTRAYAEVKRTFDPMGLMNPGKIVDPPAMDDRSLFRYGPGYVADPEAVEKRLPVVLDWSASEGLLGAAERCNNNGACRKYEPDVMCPSFRVTHDERHSTRGRANALRLALTGQLGDGGLDSPEMAEAMSLCISCKGCRRECPAGVDMARMKLEWLHRRNQQKGIPLRERLLAGLPRLAPRFAWAAPALNVLSRFPARGLVGLAPERTLPRWSRRRWRDDEVAASVRGVGGPGAGATADAALFVDTFSRWLEPEIPRAAARVLGAGGHRVTSLSSPAGARPLCCGRTYLSAGMLEEARTEARRLLEAAVPLARAGVPIVGLEPSCLYTLRDELPALLPGDDADLVAEHTMLLGEYLERAWDEGRTLAFSDPSHGPRRVLIHGHCHQKAFDGVRATIRMLERVPGLDVDLVESGCCGMAGAFGYHAEHYESSMAMAELALLPAVRAAGVGTVVVADGTSCRAQIRDGAGREAVSAVVVLDRALRA